MLMPSKTKFRKLQRGRMKGVSKGGNYISFGTYALQALEPGWIKSQQIEASRVALSKYSKKGSNLWIRIFPHKSVTKTAAETRMGKGKGSPEFWVAVVKPGRILFELDGLNEEVAKEAIELASHKLPIKTRFIKRQVV